MNWLDIVLGIVLIGSTVSGFAKGFTRTVIGMGATVLALILAMWFYGTAGGIFEDYVKSRSVSNFLGFVLVFTLVIVCGALLGKLLAAIFKWAGVGWLDRTLGACFGALRGLLISTVIVMVLMSFSMNPPPRVVASSAVAPYVIDAARIFSNVAPHELTSGFQESYDKIRQVWANALKGKFPDVPKGLPRVQKQEF